MRAIKLTAEVTRDHMLHLNLPDDVGEGPAEVIVLVPEEKEQVKRPSLTELLKRLPDSRHTMTREEIDEYIDSLRAEWE